MSIYDEVARYHREHGDDYGSVRSRNKKYRAILDLIDAAYSIGETMLDVGCGTGEFRQFVADTWDYTGIDLLNGQNVLDVTEQYDVVVANGVFYKLPHAADAQALIQHMWGLAREALVFTSLSAWGPQREGELCLDPASLLTFCATYTGRFTLRHDYLSGDLAVAMYR